MPYLEKILHLLNNQDLQRRLSSESQETIPFKSLFSTSCILIVITLNEDKLIKITLLLSHYAGYVLVTARVY